MPVPESIRPLLRDVVGSAIVVLVVLGGLWAYSGMWPPMVVIESGSMQHSHTASYVGVIDTGDLTLVRSSERVDHIVTWAEGKRTGHMTYGNYGDVIVFHKNGLEQYTPVIHRAMAWVELNATTGDTFDVPELGQYDTLQIILRDLSTYHTGVEQVVDLPINLAIVLDNFGGKATPHGGYLTKGDNNPNIDQISLFWEVQPPGTTPRAEPVRADWVVGVSRGEMPWFGILKLWFGGVGQAVPDNSWHDLLITVALLITVPVLIDLLVPLVATTLPGASPEEGERPAGLLGALSRRRRQRAGAPPASVGVPAQVPDRTPDGAAVVYRTASPPPRSMPPVVPPPQSDWYPPPPQAPVATAYRVTAPGAVPSAPPPPPLIEWAPDPAPPMRPIPPMSQRPPVPAWSQEPRPPPDPSSMPPHQAQDPVVYRYVGPAAPRTAPAFRSPGTPPPAAPVPPLPPPQRTWPSPPAAAPAAAPPTAPPAAILYRQTTPSPSLPPPPPPRQPSTPSSPLPTPARTPTPAPTQTPARVPGTGQAPRPASADRRDPAKGGPPSDTAEDAPDRAHLNNRRRQ